MKKIITLLMAVFLLLPMASCGMTTDYTNPGKDYEVNLDVDYQINAELKIGLYNLTDKDQAHFKNLEEEFRLIYPNVDLTIQSFAGTDYYAELMKAYGAGTMPDIIMVNSAMSFVGINEGILLNLDPYIQAQVALDSNYEEQFVESMWKLGQENYDGDQYFVPRSADRVVAHYNKEIFNKANVDMSLVKNGWTWDDFLTVCEQLRKYYVTYENGAGFLDCQLNWEAVMFPMLESLDGEVFDEEGNISLDSEGTRTMLTKMNELVEKGYAPASNYTPVDLTTGGAIQFNSAPADMYLTSMGDSYNVVTFPLIGDYETAKIGAGIAGYGIFSGIAEEKRDLAWKLLDFMLSKDGQNTMAKAGLTVPPIRVDMQSPNVNKWGEGKEGINLQAYVWESERNFATNFYVGQDPSKQVELVNAISTMVDDHLMRPEAKSLDTVIAECEERLAKILGK